MFFGLIKHAEHNHSFQQTCKMKMKGHESRRCFMIVIIAQSFCINLQCDEQVFTKLYLKSVTINTVLLLSDLFRTIISDCTVKSA